MITAEMVRNEVRFTGVASDKFNKFSAAEQRSVFFGQAPFGRKLFRYNAAKGCFQVRKIVAYGQDWYDADVSLAMVADALNANKPLNWYGDTIDYR